MFDLTRRMLIVHTLSACATCSFNTQCIVWIRSCSSTSCHLHCWVGLFSCPRPPNVLTGCILPSRIVAEIDCCRAQTKSCQSISSYNNCTHEAKTVASWSTCEDQSADLHVLSIHIMRSWYTSLLHFADFLKKDSHCLVHGHNRALFSWAFDMMPPST